MNVSEIIRYFSEIRLCYFSKYFLQTPVFLENGANLKRRKNVGMYLLVDGNRVCISGFYM